jgi:hypothetical protein
MKNRKLICGIITFIFVGLPMVALYVTMGKIGLTEISIIIPFFVIGVVFGVLIYNIIYKFFIGMD